MRRCLFTAPLQADALEALLPAHAQRLTVHLCAPQSGRVTRAEFMTLWRVLREQEKNQPTLKYYLAIQQGQVNAGEPACWLGLTGAPNIPLLDAARIFDALLRQHIPLFASAQASVTLDQTPLLHDLERRKGWRAAIIHGELDVLREQLKSVPAEQLLPFPRLRLARIWLMCKDARIQDAEKEWGQFRQEMTRGRYPQLPAWEAGLVRTLVAEYANAPITPVRHTWLEHLIQQIPAGNADLIGVAHNCLCHLALESGDLTRALTAADAAARAYHSTHSGYGSLFIHYHRGIAQATSGQFCKARRSYRKGLALSRQQATSTLELPAIGHALIAGLNYLDNQIKAAAQALETALVLIEQGESWSYLLWWIYRSWIRLAALEYNPAKLERAFSHVQRMARIRGFKQLQTQLTLLEIEIDLRRGDWDSAWRRTRQSQLNQLAQRAIERDLRWRHTILHARYWLLVLRVPQASAHDREQAAWLAEEGRRLQNFELQIHALLLCAQIDVRLKAHNRAFAVMDEVLSLLLPERPMRLLLDYPGIGPLLAQYRRTARSRRISRRLASWLDELERAARHDARLIRAHAHRINLTARELEVLYELAQGRRDKEIALRLSCSVHTVKFHLKHLNGKFSTHKRGDLLAAAREVGVLQ